MYACRKATKSSKPVRATSSANGRMKPTFVASQSAVDSTANVTRMRWPASRLAKSRSDSENGWIRNCVANSIGVSRTYIALGTPGMNMTFLR
jgi:hypothetical protein